MSNALETTIPTPSEFIKEWMSPTGLPASWINISSSSLVRTFTVLLKIHTCPRHNTSFFKICISQIETQMNVTLIHLHSSSPFLSIRFSSVTFLIQFIIRLCSTSICLFVDHWVRIGFLKPRNIVGTYSFNMLKKHRLSSAENGADDELRASYRATEIVARSESSKQLASPKELFIIVIWVFTCGFAFWLSKKINFVLSVELN